MTVKQIQKIIDALRKFAVHPKRCQECGQRFYSQKPIPSCATHLLTAVAVDGWQQRQQIGYN